VRGEVEAYGAGLAEKPEIVALSKADAVPQDEMKKKARALKKAAGAAPFIVSAASGEGVQKVLRVLAEHVRELRETARRNVADRRGLARGWRP
jgi:GTP-binding protein